MQKFQAKESRVGSGVQGKSSINQVLKSIKRFESHSTQQNIIFQHYYKSCCNYSLKTGRMDEEQAIFDENAFYCTLKSVLVLKIIKFLS